MNRLVFICLLLTALALAKKDSTASAVSLRLLSRHSTTLEKASLSERPLLKVLGMPGEGSEEDRRMLQGEEGR